MKTVPVIIHAGLHKTASSSVQRTLAIHRPALRQQGFEYARLNNAQGDDHINHSLPLFVAFSERYRQYPYLLARNLDADRERTRFRQELTTAIEGARVTGRALVLSGEEVASLSEGALRDMRAFFEAAHARVQICALVRAPYAMSCSDGQEWVKTGRQYRVTHRQSLPSIARIQTVFPDAQFYSFGIACVHVQGPVGFLLEQIGFTAAEPVSGAHINESLSEQVVRLIAHINAIEPTILYDQKSPIRSDKDTRPLWSLTGDRFVFLDDEFAQIETSVRAENETLGTLLGASFCDQAYPTRSAPASWTADMVERLFEVIPGLSPTIGILTYSYGCASGLFGETATRRLRSLLATADHEARRQDLIPVLLSKAEQMGPHQKARAAHLRMLAETPFT
ncbi:MAG: hypothetical protein AAFR20_09275 [Pseudomonadota bacterium]